MREKHPSKAALFEICDRLEKAGVVYAIGGSALMAHYGCETAVHDWDITTDENDQTVEDCIKGLSYQRVTPHLPFETRALFKIKIGDTSIDLMCGFALRTEAGTYHVKTKVTSHWERIPMADPHEWIKVYELMGRNEKAQMLRIALAGKA